MKKLVFALIASLALVACGADDDEIVGEAVEVRVARISALTPDVTAGGAEYANSCNVCHGMDGMGTAAGSNLVTTTYTKDQTIEIIITGALEASPAMTAFGGLSDQMIADVAAYSMAFQN